MSIQAQSVLDASALLAYLQGEAGADQVAEVLENGSFMSAAKQRPH